MQSPKLVAPEVRPMDRPCVSMSRTVPEKASGSNGVSASQTAPKRRKQARFVAPDRQLQVPFNDLPNWPRETGNRPEPASSSARRRKSIGSGVCYQSLYDRNQPSGDVVEMAHLAEELGRRFRGARFAHGGDRGSARPRDWRHQPAIISPGWALPRGGGDEGPSIARSPGRGRCRPVNSCRRRGRRHRPWCRASSTS